MKLKVETGLLPMRTYKKIGIYCLASLALATCSRKDNRNNNQLKTTNMSDYLEHEKTKIDRLMHSFSKPLKEIPPTPTADEAAAGYAVSYEVVDENVSCVIYIYENQQKHEDALKYFTNNPNVNLKNSLFSSNGRLFFWGYQKTDDPKERYTLNALAAAFAGEE
ncbi:hypothetical protein AB674_17500 [Flavobacterium sp. ABG]|nr:hypothetical protein AB674_17500 [Flavobacterium sp. ABG]